MSKKFTEEQYQKIVEVTDKYPSIGTNFFAIELCEEIEFYKNVEEMMAIANPLTREWAHEKFVEKEKEYIWESKQRTDTGRVKRLYDSAIGIVDSFKDKAEFTHNGNLITETEMRKWGYNPDMFDKREI